jgi:hypothetical protein
LSADRVRIDIAIGGDRALGQVASGRVVQRAIVPFALPAEPEGAATAFASAFQAVAGRLGEMLGRPIRAARVRVVLLPPLADVRLVPLPPMRPSEAEMVIRRDAARYFLGDAVSRVVGVAMPPRQKANAPVLAAAAPVTTAEAIRSACGFLGWRLEAILPAHTAWLGRAARVTQGRQTAGVVLAADGDTIIVIRFAGSVSSIRRLPALTAADLAEAAGSGPGTAVVFADRAMRDALSHALSASGWMVAGGSAEPQSALEAAAAGAADSIIELVPPTLAAQRRDRARTNAWLIAAAAVVLLIGAGLVELWGAKRELSEIRAERQAIREQVTPLLQARDSVSRLESRALNIERLEQESPRWTRALFDLALLLPADTHVTTMRTAGDTLVAEATGDRASAALQALRRSGSLEDIRLVGPVERELEAGETATERFRFSAILTKPVELQTVPAQAAGLPLRSDSHAVARRQP